MGQRLDTIKIAAMNEQGARDTLEVVTGINRRHNRKQSWQPWAGLGIGGVLGMGAGGLAAGPAGAVAGAAIGGLGGMFAGSIAGQRSKNKARRLELGRRMPDVDTDMLDDAVNRNYRSANIGATMGAIGLGGLGFLAGAKYAPESMDAFGFGGMALGALGGYGLGHLAGGKSDKEKAIRMLVSQNK